MKLKKKAATQTKGEEIANTLSHGAGFLAALALAPFLILHIYQFGDSLLTFGSVIFIGSVLLLYFSSSIYHAVKKESLKRQLRVVDHTAIFILIAGTYTPFTLGLLRESTGWIVFGLIWSIAVVGVVFKVFFGAKHKKFSLMLYLVMGWIAIFIIKDMWLNLPPQTFFWIIAGGIAYTLGTVFYAMPKYKYAHFVWHIFVLAGTSCHVIALLVSTI